MGTVSRLGLVLESDCWQEDSGTFDRLLVKSGAISPFPFPSNSTVVSGAVVSVKGLLPPVWSFGELFGGSCAHKLAVSCAMVMFTLDLCMELIWEKVLICWDTISQGTFTNFSEELREAFLPPGIEPKVCVSKEV